MSRNWRKRTGNGADRAFSTLSLEVSCCISGIKYWGNLGMVHARQRGSAAISGEYLQAIKLVHYITNSFNHSGHKYITLKVCDQESLPVRRELAAYNHLDTVTTSNPGGLLIRELLDCFKATGPAGDYQCLVHEPLGMSMETLKQLSPGYKLPENLLRVFLVHLLQSLDFLHTDAKMIHAGIRPSLSKALGFQDQCFQQDSVNCMHRSAIKKYTSKD